MLRSQNAVEENDGDKQLAVVRKVLSPMDLINEALDFIVEGKPISPDFMSNLTRAAQSADKKIAVIDALVSHLQISRVRTISGIIDRIEAKLTEPGEDNLFMKLVGVDPALALEALKLFYKEQGRVLDEVKSRRAGPTDAREFFTTNQTANTELAQSFSQLPPAEREKVRAIIDKVNYKITMSHRAEPDSLTKTESSESSPPEPPAASGTVDHY